ncbi:SDR family NAD(P)-dependent oxidoreductase [Leptolyngbya sp. NK1-12]|uniref:SDR family NAD(P)-dependent oxidoreductase n=1 Tax=Leptolyngbya sp. NK1-12 TaxID=2547451 RepID=A0AA96WKQ9_9CYAN|nr:SDR family NAD(P)-dependent oxidoreductase [Leptolyngbya sp. NK1-12]
MTAKLSDKVAIVTGASSGIGKATALALAAEGARIVLAARRSEKLDQVAEQIQANGGNALPIKTDVTNQTQAQQLIQKANDVFGQVDILVNSAGIAILGEIDGANPADWQRMFDLNVLGLMYTTHAVLPILKAQKTGHIVNISSVAGRIARAGVGAYNASKWAVNAFSEALRQEVYQHQIRVTVIEPGLVETELFDHVTDPVARQHNLDRLRSLRPLQGEDIAAAILYAVTQPPHVNVNEILIRPTDQER